MSPLRSLPPLLLCACAPQAADGPIGDALDLPAESAAVLAVAGPGPLAVPVRAVNAWGAAVKADPLTVDVDGTAVVVALDAYGYGIVPVTGDGAVRVEIGDVAADVVVTDGPVQGPPLARAVAPMGTAIAAVAAEGGALVATIDTVWYVGGDGRAWPVLRPVGANVRGLTAGHLDRDGILDAVVWTAEAVVLLRGRPGGGHAWLAGIDGPEALGADIGDVSGDGLADVVIAWADGLDGFVEVWEATEPETWEPAPFVDLPAVPTGVAVGDHAGVGVPQITVTDDDGGWTRLVRSAGGRYSITGPSTDQLTLELDTAATPLDDGDYDGDGAEELFIADPRVSLVERAVQVWDLFGTRPATLQVDAIGAWLDVEDAVGDGLTELWMLSDVGALTHLSWAGGLNARRPVALLVDPGPLAAGDLDGDGLAEALVAGGTGWRWWHGRSVAAEGGPWWGANPPDVERLEAAATPPLVATDLDGSDATAEIAAFVVTGGVTQVRVWQFFAGADGGPSLVGSVSLGAGATPVDLASCEGVIYALTGDTLWRIGPGATPLEVLDQVGVDGQAVGCGTGPSNSKVAVLADGVVTVRDAGLAFVAFETAPDAVAVGLVAGEVVTCAAVGCGVAGWNPSGTGDVAAWTDITGTNLGTETRLPGLGTLAVADLDGDGRDDLVATRQGAVVVHRSGGSGIGPPEAYHTGEMASSVVFVDRTGDGAADPVWLDDTGAIVWPSTAAP